MSDKTAFETKTFPAEFAKASQGTIVSIVYNNGFGKTISPPKLAALRALAAEEFKRALEENPETTIVTNDIEDHPRLNGQYTIAAAHIRKGFESPAIVVNIDAVANKLNLAFEQP